MEQWINETLLECQDLDIPGTISKPEHIQPLSRYGLDRLSLNNLGIPQSEVNRLYQSLFVYTVGFFELLATITDFIKENGNGNGGYTYQTKIWKVYMILLEYACKSDY
jgi:hypothetical protein